MTQQRSTNENPDGRELWEVVQNSDLPLILTDLRDFTVAAATEALSSQMGISPRQLIGTEIFALFRADDQVHVREALMALADGTINFYRAQRHLSPTASRYPVASIWTHAIDIGPRHFALSELSPSTGLQISPLVQHLGYTPSKVAIGVIDRDCIITAVSSNVDTVIDIPAERLIGEPLLKESDREFWTTLHKGPGKSSPCMVSWPFTSPESKELVGHVNCLLACLVGSDSYCFMLIRTDDVFERNTNVRTAELEQRLVRIAQEVQASGVLMGMDRAPDFNRFPQLGTLSTRQWEVLTRLLHGQRVAAIAAELFVSQSTVRNNLSALFGKFGVHSQAELLHLLKQ